MGYQLTRVQNRRGIAGNSSAS